MYGDSRAQTGTDADEWPARLNVGLLLESGWRPTAFRQFILKLHSRCNLACDYCYVYEMADQSWRRQPRSMTRATVDGVAARIAEHAETHQLKSVEITLHGGEPLLAGMPHLRYAVNALRSALGERTTATVQVQTNGVLLDEPFLDLLSDLNVYVGVSLDGDAEAHDRHRRRPDGRGSHGKVTAGLERLTSPPYRHLFSGLLCALDLANDPVKTYEALLEHDPPTIDFLLPHGNWDSPPPGWSPTASPYGDWLVAVFERWRSARPRETRVRLFNEIIRQLCGSPSRSESIGLAPVAVVVVETDGSIEQIDTLKSAYDGATRTPLHVLRNSFDEALFEPAIVARQIGRDALSETCLSCDLAGICGGGLYPHRYRSGSGFRNPSVYSRDLYRLITHIRSALREELAAPASRPSPAEA
ncbi:FxsB family cyclophane-forming radical SAM/SPASM peptide maturase [Nonomuraea rubra]|uniref:FxsB family cyclophane-forming radical SAM/SPASM peptide maturase n=1 Tax=Nonomuraea rubra TaxID=46180 RepID=UPI0033F25636